MKKATTTALGILLVFTLFAPAANARWYAAANRLGDGRDVLTVCPRCNTAATSLGPISSPSARTTPPTITWSGTTWTPSSCADPDGR